jgi:hypothetical protein
MRFSKEFFALQLQFAQEVVRVSNLPFAQVLLDFTTFYLSFELGRDWNSQNPIWQQFLQGLALTHNATDWTYNFYMQRQSTFLAEDVHYFGCFSYAYLSDEKTIRIHFRSNATSGQKVLNHLNMPARLADLQAMFAVIQQEVSSAKYVKGNSWLYNLEAYKRLFPPAYLKSIGAGHHEFQFLATWGQFLDHTYMVKSGMANHFLKETQKQSILAEIEKCVPYQILEPPCEISYFYDFYNL